MARHMGTPGRNFLKVQESGSLNPKLTAYKDSKGIWTIGHGTTRINGEPVVAGMVINAPVAEALFSGDVKWAEREVEASITRAIILDHQFDALVSLVYNIGPEQWHTASLRESLLRATPIKEIQFTSWNKETIPGRGLVINAGLTARRQREYRLFTAGYQGAE